MKITKNYLKQLIMEELKSEEMGTLGVEEAETYGQAKGVASQVRDTLKGGRSASGSDVSALMAQLEQYVTAHPEHEALLRKQLQNMLAILPGRTS